MAATARAIDLSDVKEGGNFRPRRKPEGDYRAKIVKADDHQPKDKAKSPGWVLTIMVEGDGRSTYPYYLSPEANQVWKIAAICRAAGLNVKNARVRFDPNKLVNKAIGIYLTDDEYEGREKSAIDDVFSVDEVGANADEGPEIDEDEDYVDEGEPEDEDEYDEPEPEPEPVKTRRRKPAPEPEPEPEDDEEETDDEEYEEEPEPAPKTRRVVRKKSAPVQDIDLDDLDEV